MRRDGQCLSEAGWRATVKVPYHVRQGKLGYPSRRCAPIGLEHRESDETRLHWQLQRPLSADWAWCVKSQACPGTGTGCNACAV